MKMPLKFWVGISLAIAGIVLMSLPDKPCVDCDDDADIYSEADEALSETPSDD